MNVLIRTSGRLGKKGPVSTRSEESAAFGENAVE
jgi:hypothetical protein